MPTAFGEKLVMRIFDPDVLVKDFSELGFSDDDKTRWQAMTFGPYFKADYQDLTIDGFTEGGPASTGFGFNVATQEIKSLDTAVGLRAQRMLTPSLGVVVPYVRFEWHKELENDQRTVSALYADTASIVPASDFANR